MPSPCMLHAQHFTTLSYMWHYYLQHIDRHPALSKLTDVAYHTSQNYAPANFSGSSLLHINLRKPCSTVYRFYPENWLQLLKKNALIQLVPGSNLVKHIEHSGRTFSQFFSVLSTNRRETTFEFTMSTSCVTHSSVK